MLRTALRSALAHRARMVMTVVAIALATAFTAAVLVYSDTVSSAVRTAALRGAEDGFDVAVTPAAGYDPNDTPLLSAAETAPLAHLPGAAAVRGSVEGPVTVADKQQRPLGADWQPRGTNYVPGKGGSDPRYPMEEGRGPRRGDEIALDSGSAARAGFRIGDTVRISSDGPVRRERLVGIFTTRDGNVAAGGTLTLFDTRTAQHLLARPGHFDRIDLTAAPGTSPAALQAAAEQALPRDRAEVETAAQLAADRARSAATGLDSLRSNLLLFAGLALFVGIFLIANTFSVLVARRTRELALLRALGASRRQVVRGVRIEALLTGLVASALGLAAGIGMGAAALALITGGPGGATPRGPLVLTPTGLIVPPAVGTAVTVLAAWLPARRAARIAPVAAMASVHTPERTRSLVLRNVLGAAVTLGGAAMVLGFSRGHSDGDVQFTALGAAVTLTGVVMLAPLLIRPVAAVAAPLLRRLGTAGTLAGRNTLRNPRRTAATAAALLIGITMITGLTGVAAAAGASGQRDAAGWLAADFSVRRTDSGWMTAALARHVAAAPGIAAAGSVTTGWGTAGSQDVTFTGLPGSDAARLVRPEVAAGSFGAFGGGRAMVSTDAAKEHGWHVGSAVAARLPDGTRTRLTVAAVYRSNELMDGVVVDSRLLEPHLTAQRPVTRLLVRTDRGAGRAGRAAVDAALDRSPALTAASAADLAGERTGSVEMWLDLLTGLLGMAVLIAVLGVVNTLALAVMERTSEIGTLRAIGLEASGVRRMVRAEAVLVSAFAGVAGVALGLFFSWAATRSLSDGGGGGFTVPWVRVAVYLVLSVAAGLAAAAWPARRASRIPPLMAAAA